MSSPRDDGPLGDHLRGDVPPAPREGYWSRIDAALADIEASPTGADPWTEDLPSAGSGRARRAGVLAAAAAVLIFAFAGFAALRSPSGEFDLATGDAPNDDSTSAIPGSSTTSATQTSSSTTSTSTPTSATTPTSSATSTSTSTSTSVLTSTSVPTSEAAPGETTTSTDRDVLRSCYHDGREGLAVRVDQTADGKLTVVRRRDTDSGVRIEVGIGRASASGVEVELWSAGSDEPATPEVWQEGGATLTMTGPSEELSVLFARCEDITQFFGEMDAALSTDQRMTG